MITPEQLRELMTDLETDRVERTTSTTNTDKFAQAVCAFANDLPGHRGPGYLLVGVRDDGVPSGVTVTDQLLQNLAALRSDGNIQPLPALAVGRLAVPGGEVAVVEVTPSDLPPVRYRGQVWIRVGPRRAIASEQEERLLSERRVAFARTFDARPCPEATLSDLAASQIEAYRLEAIDAEIIAANHRELREQLASLRFFDLRHDCPTYAAILLFGKNPRYFLPGAYVQFLRLPGEQLTDVPLDEAEISGDLLSVLRELDLRIKVNLQTTLEQESPLRERAVSDYPPVALREFLMNAVMHREYQSNTPIRFYWFADRVEIQNPGGLYGEATPENFPNQSGYRNPVVAEAMKILGYVNRFGYGVQRAQRALAENGNPPAEFSFDSGFVAVRVKRRSQ